MNDEKELNAFGFGENISVIFGQYRSVSSSVLSVKFDFNVCESVVDFGYLFIENKLFRLSNNSLNFLDRKSDGLVYSLNVF